jgi:hypothetical protein
VLECTIDDAAEIERNAQTITIANILETDLPDPDNFFNNKRPNKI